MPQSCLINSLRYISALLLCNIISSVGMTGELYPFKAIYKIGIPNITAAEMTVAVKRQDNKYLYQSEVTAKGIGHLLNIRARSHSKIIKQGTHWLPLVYEKEVTDENKKQLYRFDWKNYTAQVLYKGEQYDLTLIKGVVDENTFQLKLRADVINALDDDFDQNYTLLSDGRLKQRRFIKKGEETIESLLGKFSAIRIERYKNDMLDQIYWISPAHNYLPLKMLRMDRGKIKTTLTLNKFWSYK